MKSLFLAFMMLLVSMMSFAGTDEVTKSGSTALTGTVLDKLTNETLAGVVITLDGTETKLYSDNDGRFTLDGLTPGTHTLQVSCISYKPQEVQVTVGEPAVSPLAIKLESVEP